MLKSIATARSECTAKHENKASYHTDHIAPAFIALTKYGFVVSNFREFPKHHTKCGKIMFWPSVFPTKNQI